jgi:NADP-dependent 3-hydroxy acid dehydrogenase YdfG
MNDLTGKIAVVTGGNSGIGYATAQYFKEAGANVIITGRSADRVVTAATELGVKGIVADVTDLLAIDSLVAQVKK